MDWRVKVRLLDSIKLLILLVVRQAESIFQDWTSRWIIKYHLSDGLELPIWKLLSWQFIRNLTLRQIASIAALASFTLFTFPMGVWIASFSAAVYFPLQCMFLVALSIITTPLQLWGFKQTVKEIVFNQTTINGLILIEISYVVCVVGWWFIYQGQQQSGLA